MTSKETKPVAKTTSAGLSFAAKKLAGSGISEAEGLAMGMSVVDARELLPEFHPIKALKLAYHDLNGIDTGFYRLRYLEDLPGFGAAIAKPQRYAQAAGSLNWVYLPKHNGFNWASIAADSTQPILVTEGELKAACACIHGWPTVALGGVTVWQSSKRKVPLLPPFDKFNWKGRSVTIVFDSDAATNPQVAQAQVKLCEELLRLGATPTIASLPISITHEKQGLDDFLVGGGNLQGVVAEASQPALVGAMLNMNERFAYVADQDLVIELETQRRLKRDSLTNGLMANNKIIEFRPNMRTGLQVRHEVVVPKAWLEWACRHDVGSLVYAPGSAKLGNGNYNLWSGWGCEAKAGDIEPFHELMDFLFDGTPKEKAWFMKWLAYPLQNPGAKLYAACVLWGPETGTGKSLVGYTMAKIYGKNFAEIGNMELHMAFNEWAVGKQFVLGDEITGSDRRNEADRLKQLITQQSLRINMKHLPTYEVRDCLNYYFTSNHPDAFFIDDQDRRYFVHRVPHVRKEPAFYHAYVKWLNNGGGPALFNYLLTLDLGNFDPAAPAMLTESKMEMIDHARSDVATFVKSLMSNIDIELLRLTELLALPKVPDLLLNKHLRLLYDPDNNTKVTANGLGRELTRSGVKSLPPMKSETFGVQRFYVLRNYTKWRDAKLEDVRDHVDSIFGSTKANLYK